MQNAIIHQNMTDKNFLVCKIKTKTAKALIDSGSSLTIVSEYFTKTHNLPIKPMGESEVMGLISANTAPVHVIGTTEFLIRISGLTMPVTARVAKVLSHPFILGIDFLETYGAKIDYQLGVISLSDDMIQAPLHTPFKRDFLVTCMDSVCIPAHTEMLIPVRCPSYFNGKTILLEPLLGFQFKVVATARSFNTCEDGRTVCRVFNFRPHTVVLRRGMRIAKIQSLATLASCSLVNDKTQELSSPRVPLHSQTPEQLEDFATDYNFDINSDLTSEQRLELLQLLHDYKSAFARDLSELRRYPYYEHDVELMANKRVYKRNFRFSPQDAQTIEEQIRQMLEIGVIEKSDSHEFNSPVFLVSKKGGERRLVVDLRQLNSIIRPQPVQLPKISELLDEISCHKCNIMSNIDMRAAFWQVSLTPKSRKYTTFCSARGEKFQFKVCPFGLSTSPSAMMYVLLTVFAGKLGKNMWLYMDDLSIGSSNWSEHISSIEDVLQTLVNNNLSANPSKCQFGFSNLPFLGFLIGAHGIQMDPKKIKIIEKLSPPKNKKGLQRLIGLFNYWRKFIRGYSQHTYNMRQLLTGNAEFKWTPECNGELEYLKSCLISNPILAPVDPDKDFIIMADAAMTSGCGYQIMQYGADDKLHVVSYGGRALTDAQKRWGTAQLELASICLALRAIDCFAIHRNVIILTDNTSVLHLNSWIPQSQRERRLLTYLMQFKLTVKFIPGCRNVCADALSRAFEDMTDEDKREFLPKLSDEKEDFILSVSDNLGDLNRPLNSSSETPDDEYSGWTSYLITPDPQEGQDVLTDKPVSFQTSPLKDISDEIQINAVTPPALNDDGESENPVSQDEQSEQDPTLTDEPSEPSLDYMPSIMPSDYVDDADFKQLYAFVLDGSFEGDEKLFHQLLLTREQYFIRDGLLYKLALPRKSKLQRAYPVSERLCVPIKFRGDLLRRFHDFLGHYSVQRLFLTLYSIAFWPGMYQDITDYCKTCDVCLRTKRNFAFKTKPLNPLESPSGPCLCYQIDHKTLPRPTKQGSVAILCIIDTYSGWPILKAVPDLSAQTAARVFFNEVITKFGVPSILISDRGSAFCSKFFTYLVHLLGIKHRISSARSPRTNGLCEALVKRTSDLLRIYSKDDSFIEDSLPLCEMCLRATNHSTLKLSPYEIHMGRKMNVGMPAELSDTVPKLPQDQQSYFDWLRHRLKDIHAAVNANQAENKQEMKATYDRRHKVTDSTWCIGDEVLVLDKKVPPGSPSVLTYPYYHGPYFISDVVKGNSIGVAYKLIDVATGRVLRPLFSGDRFKRYTATDRSKMNTRLPGVATDTQMKVNQPVVDEALPPGFEPAIRILRQRTVNKVKQYLVLFQDKSRYWCTDCTPALIKDFRLREARKRRGRKH